MEPFAGKHFFCSWSGGKDSCLAFHRAVRRGGIPRFLLAAFYEDGAESRGHRLPADFVEEQAGSIGVPLVAMPTSWDEYESNLVSTLLELKDKGLEAGVFGDIELEEHREWIASVCSRTGMTPGLPLWGVKRSELVEEFIESGFEATIVAVREDTPAARFLGKVFDSSLLRELAELGIDVAGEEGEFHTAVTNGPVFSRPVAIRPRGERSLDGYRYLEF